MASIFDLAQSAAELPSLNQGTSKIIYEQHPATRDVTGTNFPNGAIHFRWQVAGSRWWIPSRTYFRMRARIRVVRANGENGRPPQISDDIAPNMSLMANLFQSAEFRIADKTVSRVGDYMAQVDALDERLSKSKAWLDSVGKLNWMQPEHAERMNEIVLDGENEAKYHNPSGVGTGVQDMGFSANDNQFSWDEGLERISFVVNAGGAIDIQSTGTQQLFPGDYIQGNVGAVAGYLWRVREVTAALTCNAELISAPAAGNVDIAVIVLATAAFAVDNFTFFRNSESYDNENTRRNGFEMIWQPPLSIFKVKHAMPAGKYEIVLNPQQISQFQKRAIESVLADKTQIATPSLADQIEFSVDNMYLYLSTVEGPRMDDLTYFLDLEQTRAQTDDIQSGTGLSQRNFDVSPSTFALTLAFQDFTAGTDSRFSASKFKIRQNDAIPPARATASNGLDLTLNRMFIQYAGQNKPQPDSDPKYSQATDVAGSAGDGDNFLSQRYADSILYSGGYFDSGGSETEEDWRKRGPYYYFAWPRDGVSESTRVNVNYEFSSSVVATVNGNANTRVGRVFLFDHHKQMALITVKDGRVTDVLVQDA